MLFCFPNVCSKSLIKLTKSRIDVIRRKKKATLKFLKKDIADLLANGLDINAYGRVIFFSCISIFAWKNYFILLIRWLL